MRRPRRAWHAPRLPHLPRRAGRRIAAVDIRCPASCGGVPRGWGARLPAMVPAGAVATEPDQDIVGSASPDQVTTDGINMDPGGESESLPPAPPTDPSQLGPDAGPASTPEPAADPDTDPTVTEADSGDRGRLRTRFRRATIAAAGAASAARSHASTAPRAGDDRRSAPANLDSAATAAPRAAQARGGAPGQPSARRAGAGAGAAGHCSCHDGASHRHPPPAGCDEARVRRRRRAHPSAATANTPSPPANPCGRSPRPSAAPGASDRRDRPRGQPPLDDQRGAHRDRQPRPADGRHEAQAAVSDAPPRGLSRREVYPEAFVDGRPRRTVR